MIKKNHNKRTKMRKEAEYLKIKNIDSKFRLPKFRPILTFYIRPGNHKMGVFTECGGKGSFEDSVYVENKLSLVFT